MVFALFSETNYRIPSSAHIPAALRLSRPHPRPKVQLQKKISHQKVSKKPIRKKRIVIFSSTGGGGHTAVSKGLKHYLKNEYDITIVNIFQEVLSSVDTLDMLTFGMISGEDFYNFCLRVRWTNLVGHFVRAGCSYFAFRQKTIENLIADYFSSEKPDLIISVIPTVNAALLAVSERLDIPFLVLTNDLDTTNYVTGIQNPSYKKFRYTLPFDDPVLLEKIKQAGITKAHVVITGFPLRPEFFVAKDTLGIKKDFGVHPRRPVVMIFMGGAGSNATYRYVRKLTKMGLPFHILACLGRNENLKRNIQKILLPPHVSITIIGFTDRIADLMAIADVIITKPGPGSLCEALQSNVPMILDRTSATIWWEELNVNFMLNRGFAEVITDFNDLITVFPKYITNKAFREEVKQRMRDFKRERFNLKIKPLISDMISLGTLQ